MQKRKGKRDRKGRATFFSILVKQKKKENSEIAKQKKSTKTAKKDRRVLVLRCKWQRKKKKKIKKFVRFSKTNKMQKFKQMQAKCFYLICSMLLLRNNTILLINNA